MLVLLLSVCSFFCWLLYLYINVVVVSCGVFAVVVVVGGGVVVFFCGICGCDVGLCVAVLYCGCIVVCCVVGVSDACECVDGDDDIMMLPLPIVFMLSFVLLLLFVVLFCLRWLFLLLWMPVFSLLCLCYYY